MGSLLWLLGLPLVCYANTIEIDSRQTYRHNDSYYLDAKFNIQLTDKALKALQNGIILDIHIQFQLELERPWLWNQQINAITLMYRIKHQPLTEDYLIIDLNRGLQYFHANLENALNQISTISKLYLFDKNHLQQGDHYIARLRAFVDLESLPPPMRPQAYFSPAWDIKSEWSEWRIMP